MTSASLRSRAPPRCPGRRSAVVKNPPLLWRLFQTQLGGRSAPWLFDAAPAAARGCGFREAARGAFLAAPAEITVSEVTYTTRVRASAVL